MAHYGAPLGGQLNVYRAYRARVEAMSPYWFVKLKGRKDAHLKGRDRREKIKFDFSRVQFLPTARANFNKLRDFTLDWRRFGQLGLQETRKRAQSVTSVFSEPCDCSDHRLQCTQNVRNSLIIKP